MNLIEASPTPAHDYWPEILQMTPVAIDVVRAARNLADHYEGRNVGAVALGVMQDQTIDYFIGANRNHYPGQNPTKQCAEDAVLKKAEAGGAIYIPVMLVCGPVQPDTQSGLETETLQSCGNCRQRVCACKLTDGDTLLVSVHPTKPIMEVNTVDEVVALHARQLSLSRSTVLRDPDFEAIAEAPERYQRASRMFAPSPQLARIALLN
jgi:cytidine deaminase